MNCFKQNWRTGDRSLINGCVDVDYDVFHVYKILTSDEFDNAQT